MKKIFSIFSIALCILLSALPLSNAHAEDLRSILSVSGSGISTAAPDRAVIHISVQSYDKDATKAQQDNVQKSNQVQQALKNLGIDVKDIKTQNYSFYPDFARDNGSKKQTIVGYSVNNTVVVTVNEINNVGPVIDTALENGANKINSLDFSLKDTTMTRKASLQNAIKDARSKADIIATGLGMKIVGVKNVSENISSNSQYATAYNSLMKADMESTPISAGTLEFESSVNIEFIIE